MANTRMIVCTCSTKSELLLGRNNKGFVLYEYNLPKDEKQMQKDHDSWKRPIDKNNQKGKKNKNKEELEPDNDGYYWFVENILYETIE
jgi:hypothetical protein